MNGITRFISFLVSAVLAVFLLVFFTTVGLALVLVVLVALFIGGLALRGKGKTFNGSTFRVVTYNFGGDDEFSGQSRKTDPDAPRLSAQVYTETSGTGASAPNSSGGGASGDCVDLSPDDYREIPPNEDTNSKK